MDNKNSCPRFRYTLIFRATQCIALRDNYLVLSAAQPVCESPDSNCKCSHYRCSIGSCYRSPVSTISLTGPCRCASCYSRHEPPDVSSHRDLGMLL